MKNKRAFIYILGIIMLVIIAILGYQLLEKNNSYATVTTNDYNKNFFELVDYMQNVQTYLAKSLISTTPEHGAITLTHVWREANLAQTYLSMLPIKSNELENTEKFLNQVSEYSYTLSRKNIYNESLTDEDLNNLKQLYDYSVELSNTLNQLSDEINANRITWKDLTKDSSTMFAQQVSNISQDSFTNLEENFHEYSGLIYDGAFSEHITSSEPKGLTGNEIDEQTAQNKAKEFIGKERIKDINNLGVSENANITSYNFSINTNSNETISIAISKKGGHIVYMNMNRNVDVENLTQEQADEKGKEFLEQKGFNNMKETYYLKQNGIVTINYAYQQEDVVIYPDLIKVKVALDNGEILGIETTGYLSSHCDRQLSSLKVSKEEVRKKLSSKIEILSENLAIIPTEWKTEILCYEFKGKINNLEFLAYFNVENGKEEDILVITNTPNGTLTM